MLLLAGCGNSAPAQTDAAQTAAAQEDNGTAAAAQEDNGTAAAAQEDNGTAAAAQNDTAPVAGKTLNFGCQMYSDGLINPAAQTNTAWNCMRFGVAEALFKFNDNMEVEPWLAESYEVSDDRQTWTIKIKNGITFSNGTPLTASKVKECLDRVREKGPEGSASPQKYLEFDALITADDAARTITIKTTKPYVNLTGNLAYPVMEIIDVSGTTNFDSGVIGTGPYMVKEFHDQAGFDMVANSNYWNGTVPYSDVKILLRSCPAPLQAAVSSRQGSSTNHASR